MMRFGTIGLYMKDMAPMRSYGDFFLFIPLAWVFCIVVLEDGLLQRSLGVACRRDVSS